MAKTPQGKAASKAYNANLREQTVRWAMLEMIRHPPKGFEEIVATHFRLKKDEIRRQLAHWVGAASPARQAAFRKLEKELNGVISAL
jgi:baculoviral IAP repeat-containing protein 6